jgi:hypothetical protein
MKHPVIACTLLAFLGLGSGAAPAAGAQPAPVVVPVDGGMTSLRLNDGNIGKDKDVVALRARRDNFNAHGFDVVSFYLVGKDGGKREFDIIPIFVEGRKGRDELHEITIGGGADGNLDDFRVLAAQGRQPARLVLAHRDFGDSYAAPGIVRFTVYELTRNEMESPGEPGLYFQQKSKASSRQKYADVNDAFDRELHMGRSGGRGNALHVAD